MRKVQADCAIDLDTNSYSVPWRLIGESVQVVVMGGRVVVRHAGDADSGSSSGRTWPAWTAPLDQCGPRRWR